MQATVSAEHSDPAITITPSPVAANAIHSESIDDSRPVVYMPDHSRSPTWQKHKMIFSTHNNMPPLVSVIMPVYNGEKYVEAAVRSALLQTVQDVELLVIDDHSTDNTAAILHRLARADARIHIFRNDKNYGTAYCRNVGLEHFEGTYAAFLDCDDIWHPDKLERQLKLAVKSKAAIIYAGYNLASRERRIPFYVPEATSLEGLLCRNVIGCSTVLLQGDVARTVRFSADYYHEDYVLWLSLLRDGYRAAGISEPLVDYRIHTQSKAFNKRNSARARWRIYREFVVLPLWQCVYYQCAYLLYGIRKYRRLL